MGVEVVDSKLSHVSAETGAEGKSSVKENGILNKGMGANEPIKFGSHGVDAPVKGEANKAPNVNFPKDAVDEWPAPKQIHSFYFVKYRSYEDQKLKATLDQADKELQKKNQARAQIVEKIRAKRADRAQLLSLIMPLSAETKQFRMIMDGKRKEMEPLQQKLGQLRGTMGGGRERGSSLCSSEEELDALIKSFQYRIQHESITLNEEKQILREIKQLEATREKVIANAATRAKIEESVGGKEALQDQVKLIGVDLDGVRKEQQAVKAKLKQLDDEKAAIEKDIESLQVELKAVTEKRDNTYQSIQELRKQREAGNASFYLNRTLLNRAKELAAKKDIEALRQLSETEVEKFIPLWAGSKAVRDDYERRILPSLDMRQLSRDGRMRNPDEKPLVLPDAPASSATVAVARANTKQPKEDSVSPPQKDAASTQKLQKEKNNKPQKEVNNKKKDTMLEQNVIEVGEATSGLEILQKDPPPKVNEVDKAKLKEMKRQEEIAKNKQALERKKKLQEKAAAKAALIAQQEAEKKLKEREKKAKKKAGASIADLDSQEPTETENAEETVAEPEKIEEKVEMPVPTKNKDRKENVVRYKARAKGPDSLPKAILKRKKATNYWVWAAPAAVLVLLLLAVGYNYLI